MQRFFSEAIIFIFHTNTNKLLYKNENIKVKNKRVSNSSVITTNAFFYTTSHHKH